MPSDFASGILFHYYFKTVRSNNKSPGVDTVHIFL